MSANAFINSQYVSICLSISVYMYIYIYIYVLNANVERLYTIYEQIN